MYCIDIDLISSIDASLESDAVPREGHDISMSRWSVLGSAAS